MSNRTNARTRTAGTPTRVTIPTGAPTAVGRDRHSLMARRPALAGRYARKYVLAIATIVALAVPAAASANLTAAGPVDPASVPFPTFYDDGAGTSLALCVNDPLCPAGPPVFTNEAPNDEAFYMAASAELSGPDGQSVSMEFAIEAAWLDPQTPITFGRIQATLDNLEPNSTYTVEHPWGESRFKTDADGTLKSGARAAQREETDGTFADTLTTPIGPFIRSVSAPAGYIGNGVTPTTVTGGPLRNSVRVTGPGLPEAVKDELGQIVTPAGITTDQFVVEGKLFDPTSPLPPPIVPVEPDTDGDGVPNNVDECVNQIGDAAHNGCPPPVIIHDPAPTPEPVVKVVEHTAVQPLAALAAAPAQPAVAKPVAPGRVTGLRVRKGRITGTSPAGANQVRITVRSNGRTVFRIGLHVRKAGQRFSATFATRARGLYTVRVTAANELGSNVAFGATTSRSFRLR